MSNTQHKTVTIIGSGPAGLTAAIYTARAGLAPLVIHGILAGGQLTTTTEVENFPGFPEGIMGPELMELLEKQAKRFGAETMHGQVLSVDFSKKPYTLNCESGTITTDTLIISTGASPRWLNVPGEKDLMGYGVSSCATCDGAFFKGKEIAVVGGGDSACEEALFLTRFGTKVYLIHRRDSLRASKIMQERVLAHEKIVPVWDSAIKEIYGTKEAGVTKILVTNLKDNSEKEIAVSAVFVAIGHTPTSGLFKGMITMDENGYIVPTPNSTATNVPGVFACGDVQDHVFRQAITAAGSGCMAAIEAERWLTEHE